MEACGWIEVVFSELVLFHCTQAALVGRASNELPTLQKTLSVKPEDVHT